MAQNYARLRRSPLSFGGSLTGQHPVPTPVTARTFQFGFANVLAFPKFSNQWAIFTPSQLVALTASSVSTEIRRSCKALSHTYSLRVGISRGVASCIIRITNHMRWFASSGKRRAKRCDHALGGFQIAANGWRDLCALLYCR